MRPSRNMGRWVSGSEVLRWWGFEVLGYWGVRYWGFEVVRYWVFGEFEENLKPPKPYDPNTPTP